MTHIVDHPFTPKPGEEWGLCRFVVDTTDVDRGEGFVDQLDRTCGLAAPAHHDVPEPYQPTAARAGTVRTTTPGSPAVVRVVREFTGGPRSDDPAFGLADPITRTLA